MNSIKPLFFTSSRPFIFRGYLEIADHVAPALDVVRDITIISHRIEDMSGFTINDLLSATYKKLDCSISTLEKNSNDYEMIVKYLEKTYEHVKVCDIEYGMSVENIFVLEPSSCPSYEDIWK
ncbi:unnamed protein product [Lathyrus oleraceus]